MLRNFFRHLHTINRHRRFVKRHCRRCGIGWQGQFHDLSKYSRCEFRAGIKYYQGYRSPNDMEREQLGYSEAWMHHKGCNRHHYEYWTDYDPVTRSMRPVEMPVRYAAEMFCDRVAASKTYNGDKYTDGDSLEYYLRSKGRRVIHPATEELLEGWLTVLAEKGEKTAFRTVRGAVRADRRSRRRMKRASRKVSRASKKQK